MQYLMVSKFVMVIALIVLFAIFFYHAVVYARTKHLEKLLKYRTIENKRLLEENKKLKQSNAKLHSKLSAMRKRMRRSRRRQERTDKYEHR